MAITNPFRCTLNINFKNAGWSEKYFLSAGSYGVALDQASKIALYRTVFFGKEVELVYAHVSRTDTTKDAVSCDLGFPLGPHKSVPADVNKPNDAFSAVQQRFETADGRWMNRMYRGVPDNEVYGQIIQTPDQWRPLPTGTAPFDPTGNANRLSIARSFWTYLIQVSPHMRKVSGTTYNDTPFVRIIPIRVSKHATGRPFGLFRGRHASNLVS
jgi:hypothetical protein